MSAPSTTPRASESLARADLVVVLVLVALTFFGSWRVSAALEPFIYDEIRQLDDGRYLRTFNIWFDADFPKIMAMMMGREEPHPEFAAKHPIHRSLMYTFAYGLKRLGFTPVNRLRAFAAVGAALWVAALYALLRCIVLRRRDAILFTLLGLSSAAGMFWLVTPESFVLGSITIMIPLGVAALVERRNVPLWGFVAASAASLSITITNWMVGIFVTWFSQPWRRFLGITAGAFAVVSALWALQLLIIPHAVYFLSVGQYGSRFAFHPDAGGPGRVVTSFLAHTMVMPQIVVHSASEPAWYGMTTQMSAPGSAGPLSVAAVILWAMLLGMGCYALARLGTHKVLRWTLVATAAMQVVLHLIYGYETFLYSLHFLPLLLSAAALATLTRWRRQVLGLAGAVLVVCAVNNARQLSKAVDIVRQIGAIRIAPP